jgi:hypothetical protein
VAFAGKTAMLSDSKGLRYVARLLTEPYPAKPVGALTLYGQDENLARVEQTLQPILDEEAKREYGAQLKKLNDDIEEAREFGNQEEQVELERQRGTLADQLQSAISSHGKDRELGSYSPTRRAAEAVRKALDRAYDQMAEHDLSELVHHLRQTIRPERNAFAYRPAPPAPPWEL